VQFVLEHHIIPDGISSIVQLTIKAEFTVPTDGAPHLAEGVIVEIASRLTGKPQEEVQRILVDQSLQNLFMSDIRRPDEESPG
jgi:hypothetical protein